MFGDGTRISTHQEWELLMPSCSWLIRRSRVNDAKNLFQTVIKFLSEKQVSASYVFIWLVVNTDLYSIMVPLAMAKMWLFLRGAWMTKSLNISPTNSPTSITLELHMVWLTTAFLAQYPHFRCCCNQLGDWKATLGNSTKSAPVNDFINNIKWRK